MASGVAIVNPSISEAKSLMRTFAALLVVFLLSPLAFSQNAARHGIDPSDLDRKVEPCTDFYQFANGAWHARNPIPASMSRWSRRWQAGETAKDRLKDILEAIPEKNPNGSAEQLIGDYYRACMNESRANARGVEPLKPWFAKIDASKDMAALQQVMAEMHDIQVAVPFNLAGQQNFHNPTQVLADIGASGYDLPDRDYYLKPDDRFKDARAKYVEHIGKMFKLAGWDDKSAAASAQTLLTMETKFAEASLDKVALRDPSSLDHKTKFPELQALASF